MIRFITLAVVALSLLPASLWGQIAVRSAASYGETVSPESLAALFGSGLASMVGAGQTDNRGMWPRELAGVRVEVNGVAAGLLFVSPNQINFTVPPNTALGSVDVVVKNADGGVIASGVMEVADSAPALFSVDGSGSGAVLAFNRWTEERGPFSLTTAANPGCDKRTMLSALATGLRLPAGVEPDPLDSNLAGSVRVVFDGVAGPIESDEVEYAGPDEALEGADRVDFVLPEELPGSDEVAIRLVVDSEESNAVVVPLEPGDGENADCVSDGFVVAFNTVADLLAGDLWDVTQPQTVFASLADVPEHWPLMGVGTTAETGHNGEVIVFGTAGMPELVWSDPLFPLTVRTLGDEPIPYVGVAAGNPDHAIVAEAEPGRPIHAQVVELAEANGLAFAGVRVSGQFTDISYSVAHNLLKEGTPLTDPSVDKAPFQLFFDVAEEAEWEISGFYGASARVQEIVSVRGAPVHLHGFQLDRSRAGHLGGATVENATIRLYPLQAPLVEDADLAVRIVAAEPGGVVFEVVNRGNNAVTRTTVQGQAGGQVVFQITLPELAGRTSTSIEAALPDGAADDGLWILVDPFNDVLESDEANNSAYVP